MRVSWMSDRYSMYKYFFSCKTVIRSSMPSRFLKESGNMRSLMPFKSWEILNISSVIECNEKCFLFFCKKKKKGVLEFSLQTWTKTNKSRMFSRKPSLPSSNLGPETSEKTINWRSYLFIFTLKDFLFSFGGGVVSATVSVPKQHQIGFKWLAPTWS
jgi:hypothetical protein